MRRRKINIFKNIALICALIVISLIPLPVAEAANFTVSKTNVTLDAGKSTTITINASTHTGRVDIVSSNTNVAIVNENSLWVENNSKTITITAKSAGSAKITIKGELFDANTEEEREFTQTVNVTVKATSSNSNNSNINTNQSTGGNTSSNISGSTQTGNSSSVNNSKPTTNSGSTNSQTQTSSKPTSSTTNKTSSNNSTTNINKPAQNNTTVIDQETTIQENVEEIVNDSVTKEENVPEEISQEEAKEEEKLHEETIKNAETNNVEGTTTVDSRGKIILFIAIGVIALAMIFIGVGVSKNILKK